MAGPAICASEQTRDPNSKESTISRDKHNPEAHGKNAEPKLIDLEYTGFLVFSQRAWRITARKGSKADRHRRKNDVKKAHRKGN